jgi:hypothetical protein
MSGRNIIAIVLAIVVGIVVIKVAAALLGFFMGVLGFVIWAAVIGGVVYFLYRKFNHMLTSGKRLT